MSEIKGQILGIIITLVLFGTVSAVLTATFTAYNEKIVEEVETNTGKEINVGNYLSY